MFKQLFQRSTSAKEPADSPEVPETNAEVKDVGTLPPTPVEPENTETGGLFRSAEPLGLEHAKWHFAPAEKKAGTSRCPPNPNNQTKPPLLASMPARISLSVVATEVSDS